LRYFSRVGIVVNTDVRWFRVVRSSFVACIMGEKMLKINHQKSRLRDSAVWCHGHPTVPATFGKDFDSEFLCHQMLRVMVLGSNSPLSLGPKFAGCHAKGLLRSCYPYRCGCSGGKSMCELTNYYEGAVAALCSF
jgi:hypothetical protein